MAHRQQDGEREREVDEHEREGGGRAGGYFTGATGTPWPTVNALDGFAAGTGEAPGFFGRPLMPAFPVAPLLVPVAFACVILGFDLVRPGRALRWGVPFPLTLLLAGLGAGAVGLLLGVPALRLTGLYLAIATLAFSLIVEHLMAHWKWLSAGETFMTVPKPVLAGLDFGGGRPFYFAALAVLVLVVLAVLNLLRAPIGRAFIALRDSPIAAETLGVALARTKATAFALSAAITGLAGALYAHKITVLNAESFNVLVSLQLLMMVVVGGLGTVRGALYGAGFADFLSAFDPARHLPYLPDVARLEWAINESYHAVDAKILDPQLIAAVPIARYADLMFILHPSCRLVASPYPIEGIWRANQPDRDGAASLDAPGSHLLVHRHDLDVGLAEIGRAAAALNAGWVIFNHPLSPARFAQIAGDLPSKINLIPFNEFPGSPFRRPTTQHVLRFQSILREAGFDVFVRKSRGRDVLGACGQLGELSAGHPPVVLTPIESRC